MNRALWIKAFHESKWLLLGCALLMFIFQWLRVWIISQIKVAHVRKILSDYVPEFVQKLLPVSIEELASTSGRIAIGYEEPILLVLLVLWAVGRASDSVSGEIGRGTMEMLLAQPVRRVYLLNVHTVVTLVGVAILAAWAWLGTVAGIATVELEEPVHARTFGPAAANLMCLGVLVAGVTTMFSAIDQNRGRTIGIAVGLFMFQLIIKIVGRTADQLDWLRYATVLTAFEPQVLARSTGTPVSTILLYNGLLVGLAAVFYAVAVAVFCRRDIPAPL
ncbi:MAG: ABC transporter permease subunit [Pirellulales bacterium]